MLFCDLDWSLLEETEQRQNIIRICKHRKQAETLETVVKKLASWG